MKNLHELPEAISSYIAATNSGDIKKFLAVFKNDAVITDEGRTYLGIKDIEAWRRKSVASFQFGLELTEVDFLGDEILVQTNCTGNFPGSPVMLQQRFSIENNLITSLRITG